MLHVKHFLVKFYNFFRIYFNKVFHVKQNKVTFLVKQLIKLHKSQNSKNLKYYLYILNKHFLFA